MEAASARTKMVSRVIAMETALGYYDLRSCRVRGSEPTEQWVCRPFQPQDQLAPVTTVLVAAEAEQRPRCCERAHARNSEPRRSPSGRSAMPCSATVSAK